jgi:hypothetical protein
VFGESPNDTSAIRNLIVGLRPDLRDHVETRRDPLVLTQEKSPTKAKTNHQRIAGLVRQESAAKTVLAVVAHHDCDAVEPAHTDVAKQIEDGIKDAGCILPVIGVAPAWEIEAWWMLFPEAVGKVVEGWREPDDWLGRNVGMVENAKENLTKAVHPKSSKGKRRTREYEERDSIKIASNIDEFGLHSSFANGQRKSTKQGRTVHTRSASFEAFRLKVLKIPLHR